MLRTIRDKFCKEHPKLLVVGPPRSGFTLLISILNRLLSFKRFRRDPLRHELQTFMPQASKDVYKAIEDYFGKRMSLNDLIISPEFKLLVGGPKWLSKENPNTSCVRKYIGIRGSGDFLAILSLPRFVMDYYSVVHSHYNPNLWLEESYYQDYLKFSSIRNPVDIINSSVFSLNALTGEYINRYVHEDSDAVRDRLALYKLTDLNFIEGLVTPLLEYLRSFVEVREHYSIMRWEDLIMEPERAITAIAHSAGIDVPSGVAGRIWQSMKNKNQTTHHTYNFRKGVIGDWKNHLLNEHLEILKGHGFDEFTEAFGYGKIEHLDKKDYTSFQKTVEDYIRRGQVFKEFDDPNLFTFAFNKSNFRSAKYDFVSCAGHGDVKIERSSIKDEELLKGFIRVTEEVLGPVKESLNAIYERCRP